MITYKSTRLVGRHRGTLPVVLSCPHDGGAAAPVPERTGARLPRGCQFTKERDLNTRTVTTGVAQRLLELTGEAPYVVFAEFHRKYIDANRSPKCAYEAAAARPYYDEYHRTLRGFVDEVRGESGGPGLLFDIHGTAGLEGNPADLYLGTDGDKSIARLRQIDRHALSRRRGFGGLLAAAGYAVALNAPRLGGGYTIETYGSSHANGIDAIQVEIVRELRRNAKKRAILIDNLARAICSLVDRYVGGGTSTAFQNIELLDASDQSSIAQLRQRAVRDSCLSLGGHGHRGRLDLRDDRTPPRRSGVLVLHDENGKPHFLWVDTQGALRIARYDPGSDSGAGEIVGGQP